MLADRFVGDGSGGLVTLKLQFSAAGKLFAIHGPTFRILALLSKIENKKLLLCRESSDGIRKMLLQLECRSYIQAILTFEDNRLLMKMLFFLANSSRFLLEKSSSFRRLR
jgi:hypothetical protein